MNGKPVGVPTIDQLVADPGKIFQLPPDAARSFLRDVCSILPALTAQSSLDTGKAEVPAPEQWLTVEQVVSQFGVTERWLYRHKRQLPHSQPSRKVLLFPEERLRKWFASRKTG